MFSYNNLAVNSGSDSSRGSVGEGISSVEVGVVCIVWVGCCGSGALVGRLCQSVLLWNSKAVMLPRAAS